jgi:hypothetical protein
MLLDSQSRLEISTLKIDSPSLISKPCFSSRAFHRFITGNKKLKVVNLTGQRIDGDSCEILGKAPQGLDSLKLKHCILDVHALVDAIGNNVCGPSKISFFTCKKLDTEDPQVNFSSTLVPLLKCARVKVLYLHGMPCH